MTTREESILGFLKWRQNAINDILERQENDIMLALNQGADKAYIENIITAAANEIASLAGCVPIDL